MQVKIDFSNLNDAQMDLFRDHLEKKYGCLLDAPFRRLVELVEEKILDERRRSAEISILSKFCKECLRRREKEGHA